MNSNSNIFRGIQPMIYRYTVFLVPFSKVYFTFTYNIYHFKIFVLGPEPHSLFCLFKWKIIRTFSTNQVTHLIKQKDNSVPGLISYISNSNT